MQPTTIEVLQDTHIIENNTADSLRVVLKYEKDIEGDYQHDGKIITGENLKEIDSIPTTLGDLKTRVQSIQDSILAAQHDIADKQAELSGVQSMIELITPKVNDSIETAISDGATDNRN